MKQSITKMAALTMIVGGAVNVAHAQSSVTIYGIIDTSISYTNKALVSAGGTATGSKMNIDSGMNSGSRFGFKGTEDLGGGMSALFQLETGLKSDTGAYDGTNNGVANTSTLFRRVSVMGLSGNWGSVLLGRQADAVFQYNPLTSVGDFGAIVGAVGHNLDRLEGVRTNNSIRYNTPTFSGFSASALYGLGEVAGDNAAGQAMGLGTQYLNGPLALFAAYYQSKLGADATDVSSDTATLVAGNGKAGDTALKVSNVGASYQAGPARLYTEWSQVRQPLATSAAVPDSGVLPSGYIIGGANNNKANIYEVGINYTLNAQLALIGSVQHTVLNYAGNTSMKGKLTQINIGTDYFFSNRTDIYTVVAHLSAADTYSPGAETSAAGQNNSQTVISVGLRHKF